MTDGTYRKVPASVERQEWVSATGKPLEMVSELGTGRRQLADFRQCLDQTVSLPMSVPGGECPWR